MRFSFAYDVVSRRVLGILGAGSSRSWVEIEEGLFRVRMGWAFRLESPVQSIASAEEVEDPIGLAYGIGVHGWARKWAVNGARRPHVVIRFAVPELGYTLRVPVWVEVLHLSPADPPALLEALGAPPPG